MVSEAEQYKSEDQSNKGKVEATNCLEISWTSISLQRRMIDKQV